MCGGGGGEGREGKGGGGSVGGHGDGEGREGCRCVRGGGGGGVLSDGLTSIDTPFFVPLPPPHPTPSTPAPTVRPLQTRGCIPHPFTLAACVEIRFITVSAKIGKATSRTTQVQQPKAARSVACRQARRQFLPPE